MRRMDTGTGIPIPGRAFRLLALGIAAITTGCGASSRLAVHSMVPILNESVIQTYRDADVETAKEAMPGSLVLLRGMCASQPDDRNLSGLTAQLYYSYGMGFVEDEDPARAQSLYAEGLRIGRAALLRRGWFARADAAVPLPDSSAVAKMCRDDVPLMVWTLANWASWIGLNVQDPEAVAQLPRLQVYLDRVLALQPDYFFGLPHALAGAMLCFRPRLFGGNPDKGKGEFDEAFRISGGKLLIYQVYYARYYCRQVMNENEFNRALQQVLDAPPDLFPEYRLLNEVARIKARRLMEMRDELF